MGLLPTFTDYLDGQVDVADPASARLVTEAWVQYDQAMWLALREMKSDPDRPGTYRDFLDAISQDIIVSHLGTDWFAEHVDGAAASDLAGSYLDVEGPPEARLLAVHRVHELARRLYELQSFPWFGSLLDRLKTRDLSGAGFELDVTHLLHVLIPVIDSREESGVKGEDYDIRAAIFNLSIPIEVKAKDDTTAFTRETVINTLKKAAQQLPKGEKGLVFLRIPSTWIGTELEESYAEALAEGTRSTSRIAVVITVIDKTVLTDGNTKGRVVRHYDLFRHPDCHDELWEVCLRLKEVLDADMKQLAPIAPF